MDACKQTAAIFVTLFHVTWLFSQWFARKLFESDGPVIFTGCLPIKHPVSIIVSLKT